MIKIIFAIFCCLIFINAFGQDGKLYYDFGMEKAKAGKLEEAIKLLDTAIQIKPDEYVAWYNRAIIKSMLNQFEDALTDLDQTLKLYPNYKKAYLNRGSAKRHLTDYKGALSDYSNAIQLDSNYSEAYFDRGLVYDMLSKNDSACLDFNLALKKGLKRATKKVEFCKDTTKYLLYPILRLTKTAENKNYGFSSEDPVKVGPGPEGGPANQRAYLDLLRDEMGKSIKYKRLGSCCEYKSENGYQGIGKLDKYEITYLNDKGEEKTTLVFISFYDYEDPKILSGFKTIGMK